MKRITPITVNLHASINEYTFHLDVFVFPDKDEEGTLDAYCPALDLITTGTSIDEAIHNFCECFKLHIECCIEWGTLQDDLRTHGWNFQPLLYASTIRPTKA